MTLLGNGREESMIRQRSTGVGYVLALLLCFITCIYGTYSFVYSNYFTVIKKIKKVFLK